MSRKNKTAGYSKKYASAMKSFDRSMDRLAHSVSHVTFSSKSTAKVQTPDSTFEERQRASLTGKQLLIACAVGSILPLMALLGVDEIVDEIDGVFLAVLVFFFLIPFLVMVLILRSSISSHGHIQHNRSLHLRKKQKNLCIHQTLNGWGRQISSTPARTQRFWLRSF